MCISEVCVCVCVCVCETQTQISQQYVTQYTGQLVWRQQSNQLPLQLPRTVAASNCKYILQLYVYGSVQCRSILIIVQRDATQSSLSIILQVHSIVTVLCTPDDGCG